VRDPPPIPMRILVTGATGYLGQFLLERLVDTFPDDVELFYTYTSAARPAALAPRGKEARGFRVDFASGEGLEVRHCALFLFIPETQTVLS
jgi:uncharacterized protein YbjT (DUF2867 family)